MWLTFSFAFLFHSWSTPRCCRPSMVSQGIISTSRIEWSFVTFPQVIEAESEADNCLCNHPCMSIQIARCWLFSSLPGFLDFELRIDVYGLEVNKKSHSQRLNSGSGSSPKKSKVLYLMMILVVKFLTQDCLLMFDRWSLSNRKEKRGKLARRFVTCGCILKPLTFGSKMGLMSI